MAAQLIPGLEERLCKHCGELITPSITDDERWSGEYSHAGLGNSDHAPYEEGEYDSFKFSSELAEILWIFTLDSGQDDDCGEADTFGWYALFRDIDCILSVDSRGSVTVQYYGGQSPNASEVFEELEIQWEAHNTFECELCREVTPDTDGQNVRSDDGFMTVCGLCYDSSTMQTIFS